MASSNFLQRSIYWLEKRRLINVLLVLAYSVFIFFMHNPVVLLSVWVMKLLTLPIYNKVVLVIFTLFIILFTTFLLTQLKKYPGNYPLKLLYLFASIAFIIIHFKLMFEMNIEIIHIYEYPLLAILIFPLTRRFGPAVLFALPVMLLDEWHQYMVLYPAYVEYLELNDVMIDIYGCGLAMATLMICGVARKEMINPFWKRPEFITLCLILFGFIIAVKTCFFCYYPADKCSNTYMVLNKLEEPEKFWRQFKNRPVIYHVSTPFESVVIITSLCLFYFGLDSFYKVPQLEKS
jgi:hypothetical protein